MSNKIDKYIIPKKRKIMNKYQLKERTIILVIYAMIKEGFNSLNLEPTEIDISKFEYLEDLKLISLYKKLNKLNKIFLNKKVLNFFNKRMEKINDDINKDCQVLIIGIIIFYFYKNIDIRRNIVINDISSNDIKNILIDFNNEFNITKCTLNKSIELFLAIYPDKESYINFLNISNRFPFDIIK